MPYILVFDVLDCVTKTVTTPELVERYPYPFRLLDGDNNIHYYGRSETCDDEAAFVPLEWAKVDSGCTTIEYCDNWGEWIPM